MDSSIIEKLLAETLLKSSSPKLVFLGEVVLGPISDPLRLSTVAPNTFGPLGSPVAAEKVGWASLLKFQTDTKKAANTKMAAAKYGYLFLFILIFKTGFYLYK